MRLDIIIVTICDSLIGILVPSFFSSLKIENGLKKHIEMSLELNFHPSKLVAIFFTFYKKQFDHDWLKRDACRCYIVYIVLFFQQYHINEPASCFLASSCYSVHIS